MVIMTRQLVITVGVMLMLLISLATAVTYNPACNCGQKNTALTRIVGGVVTEINEWPWQVALKYDSALFCGGSLINDRYVLTASHCVDGLMADNINVHLGVHQISTISESHSVSQITMHELYQEGPEVNDIALLRLSSPVLIPGDVLPVCLPPAIQTYAHTVATVTGWGTTSSGGSYPDILREVNVTVWSNTACRDAYSISSIKVTMLCAGDTGKDSCQGDSGGALVHRDGGGNYNQIGIVSWGVGCGDENYPGVYTRVSEYLDWIVSNTADGIYCRGWHWHHG